MKNNEKIVSQLSFECWYLVCIEIQKNTFIQIDICLDGEFYNFSNDDFVEFIPVNNNLLN